MKFAHAAHPAVRAGLVASVGVVAALAITPGIAYGEAADSTPRSEVEYGNPEFSPVEDGGVSSSNDAEDVIAGGASDSSSESSAGHLASAPDAGGPDGSGESAGAPVLSGDACAGSGSIEMPSGGLPSCEVDDGLPDEVANGGTAQQYASLAANDELLDSVPTAPQQTGNPGWNGLTYNDACGNPFTGWVVDDHAGTGLQRYYIQDGTALTGLFEEVLAGVRSWFYAHEDGTVVRGKWDNGAGRVYLAGNDGRLAALGADGCGSGWLVTAEYDGGLRRYYIDGAAHAAVSGYFNVDASGRLRPEGGAGESYFGLGGEGYVLRGAGRGVRGDRLYADNDGRLAKNEWVVTSTFGQGLQRYWFDGSAAVAKEGLYDTGGGWWTYVTDQGYVLRGKHDTGRGRVYVADNDGRLAALGADGGGSGWLVTGAYDGGALQRYYIDGEAHAAVSGFFKVGDSAYFGVGGKGYVLRGHASWGSSVLLANNGGVMPGAAGWVFSDDYNQGLQRYWIDGVAGQPGYFGAKTGFFSVGNSDYYGRSEGYVLRGGMVVGDRFVYANNDGVILERAKVIDAIVNFMIKIASDDSHGYTQGNNRWGQLGDYDCSALVITALRQAGLDTGAADNTRNMRQELTKVGFDWVTDLSSLQKGDILLWEGVHTAMYLGDGLIAHAVSNEFGGILGGVPGDQTGREIRIQTYDSYQKRWTGILRLKG
ncbi:NlpC/P60 family protein [Enorma phocaeensis]|uniref:NlpC/P60 family protein n=1 Tax=Enorma phocaeensis TaxID=1871019 RepID=UPI0023569E94|nr:NlpC/P60 family protein [Enorma phocaeensis]